MAGNKTAQCKKCGTEIPAGAKVCPQCGAKVKKPFFTRPWFIILAVVVVVGVIASSSGNRKDDPKESQNSSESKQQEAKNNTEKTEPSTGAKTEPSTAPSAAPIKDFYTIGDTVESDGLKIVFIASGEYTEENQFMQPKEGNRYVFMKFAFTNTSKRDTGVSVYSFNGYADGYACETHYVTDDTISATLSPNRSTVGSFIFEVPKNAKEIEAEYEVSIISSKKIRFVYEENKDSGYVFEPVLTRTEGALSVGDKVKGSYLTITYLSCKPYVSDNMFLQPAEGYQYISIEVEVENTGSSDRTVSSISFNGYADGLACGQTYVRDDNLSGTISSGRKIKGTVTFEVPKNAMVIEAEFDESILSGKKVVFTIR